MSDGLTDRENSIIRGVLSQYADRIDRVALFGSRAAGNARENSDIDLVLFGDISDAEVDRLWTLFEDSPLSVSVDVLIYRDDLYPPLRDHIDAVARPLFERADLSAVSGIADQ